MRLGRRLSVVVLAGWLSAGCGFLAGAAVGGAGVVYLRGEASKAYPRDVPQVYRAALSTLEALSVVVTERLEGDQLATIKGRTAGGDELTMRIERENRGVSRVKLRVGLLGNRDYSQVVFSRMDRKLGL